VAAVGGSITVGFVGAPGHEEFDWALAAEIGTALGTILLASYTAWLATTTREEVGLAIAEQRARDRPIIVVTPGEIGARPLDVTIGQMVAVLTVRVQNIGLGPALELVIQATTRGTGPAADDASTVWTEEIRAVWTVDHDEEVDLSLARFDQPPDGFRPDGFHIQGSYTDRRHAERYEVEVLSDAGLRDEQREAVRLAQSRASLAFSSGMPRDIAGETATYHPQVLNNGRGAATNVELRFLRSEDGQYFAETFAVPDIGPGASEYIDVELPMPHPWLSAQLSWRDGVSRFNVGQPNVGQLAERVYPELLIPPAEAPPSGAN
jgi:hypothetical protein